MTAAIQLLGADGKPIEQANGHAPTFNGKRRFEVPSAAQLRRIRATYDAARDSDQTRNHWANADNLNSDSANSKAVRHKLLKNSRYEHGSNGFYAGSIRTHCNLIVGIGPKLRVLTRNRRFNQMVELEFYNWAQRVQFRRKLWCMAHARTQDGEVFAILQTNPRIFDGIQLDFQLIEAEQCQTPFPPFMQAGYIDGIRFDEFNNVLWYDVLPYHPGSGSVFLNTEPIRVLPENMLHWFKMERPGEHRSVPVLTPSMNVGAHSRRWREAVVGSAETAASHSVLLETANEAAEVDELDPWMSWDVPHRLATALPLGWRMRQLASEHPNAQHGEFHRTQVAEQVRPMSQPVNLAMCDSSTYSFASGKLDTLAYRAELDVEREDCQDLVLNPLFASWYREFSLFRQLRRRRLPPHKWDWPAHPIIDVEAESRSADTQLKNGRLSLRQYHTNGGSDYDDDLEVQAEDAFGDSDDESIEKIRKINVLRNTPAQALPYVAEILGVSIEQPEPSRPALAASKRKRRAKA